MIKLNKQIYINNDLFKVILKLAVSKAVTKKREYL